MFQHFYDEPYAFLLESVEGGVNLARYSFIGTDPFMVIRGKNGRFTIEQGRTRGDVRKAIQSKYCASLSCGYRSPALPDLPPFTGGAIGFFGYDLLQYYETHARASPAMI